MQVAIIILCMLYSLHATMPLQKLLQGWPVKPSITRSWNPKLDYLLQKRNSHSMSALFNKTLIGKRLWRRSSSLGPIPYILTTTAQRNAKSEVCIYVTVNWDRNRCSRVNWKQLAYTCMQPTSQAAQSVSSSTLILLYYF